MDFVSSKPFVLLFLLLSCSQFTVDGEDIRVNPTELRHKGAAAYYFAPGSDEGVHNWVVFLPRPTKTLPKSCTSKFSPAMIAYTTGKSYIDCVNNKNCTSDEIKVMQDLRSELLDVLPEQDNHSSRGFLIVSSFGHVHTLYSHWYEPAAGTNKTMANMFGDWYFDRKVVQIIEKCDDPYICQ
nr:pectin acetylesterase 8-like [Ipomoea batatas]GMD92735.1 pectin acetylesterase 8-like [Ipomoea batatas]